MPDSKPNIVFIITDQQRYDTISAQGFSYVDTPNLDWYMKGFVLRIILSPLLLAGLPGQACSPGTIHTQPVYIEMLKYGNTPGLKI
jgi:hypothetical protein